MNALRIGWVTPWNDRSAIAHSASGVAFELSRRGHDVTVLRMEVGTDLALPPLPAPGPVHHFADYPLKRCEQDFDVVVAHIGNNLGFHGALPARMREIEFVGIFHDAFFADLALGWHHGDLVKLRELVGQLYGDVWPAEEPYFCELGRLMRRRPMLEWLAQWAVGGVAHSGHYMDRLRRACRGPIAVIPLAFTTPNLPPPPLPWDRLTIAVVGHANPNKRIDQLILGIGASPMLRTCCRVRVIGAITPPERARLTSLAEAVRLEPVEFTGWVTDRELRWRLRDVDVMSCLRNPVLEGASASLVLAQSSARPTLVSDHGCYAEVPPDTVLACSPEHEARDVLRHLEWLVANPAAGLEIGRRARSLALQRHAPATYVDQLLPLLEEVIAQRPANRPRRASVGSGSHARGPSIVAPEPLVASNSDIGS